jgi:hypothetical protein
VQRGPNGGRHFIRVSAFKAIGAAGFRERGEIDRRLLAAVGGIAELFLFEEYFGEAIVLMNDDLDGQLVLHGRDEFTHELRESTIPHNGHRLTIRESQLRGDRKGQARRHGR